MTNDDSLMEGLKRDHQWIKILVSGSNRGSRISLPVSGMRNTSKLARTHWEKFNMFFGYPSDIRKAICTMNAIEPRDTAGDQETQDFPY